MGNHFCVSYRCPCGAYFCSLCRTYCNCGRTAYINFEPYKADTPDLVKENERLKQTIGELSERIITLEQTIEDLSFDRCDNG